MKSVQASAFVSVVPLRAEPEVVVLEGDPDVRRAGFGVPFGVGCTFGSEELAGLPSLRPEEALAIGLGVARPLGVVGVVSKLSLAVWVVSFGLFAGMNLREEGYFLAPARPMVD